MDIVRNRAVLAYRVVRTTLFCALFVLGAAGCTEVEDKYGTHRLKVPRPVSITEPGKPGGGFRSAGIMRARDGRARDALTHRVYDFGSGYDEQTGQRQSLVTTNATGEMVTLNFAEASMREVVDAVLGKTLEVPYVFDERVGGTVTARTTDAIPRSNVLPVLENILALHGAALVKDAGVYSVVPREAVPNLPKTVVTAGGGPISQGAGVYVIPLENASVSSMAEVLEGQVGQGSQLAVDKERNILIFTGPASEARVIHELASVLDVDALKGKSFALYPVQAASAENIVVELQAMFADEGNAIQFLPITRLNAVLAISRRPATLRRVGKWVRNLDKADSKAGQQTFVYYAKNSQATELASVLTDAFGVSSSAAAAQRAAVAPGLAPAQLATPVAAVAEGEDGNGIVEPESQVIASPASAARTGRTVYDAAAGIRIVADETRNALVIMATGEQITLIRDVLQRIDVMPLQVLIEATIAEVTLNDELRYGVQWALTEGNFALNWVNASTGVVASAFPGSNLSFDTADAKAVLNALSDVTDVEVVSSPQLMVLDNQSARLQIGDQVPVLTQTSVSTANPDAPIVNAVQYVDTGVIFEVTPRVNASGLVTLDILQEVSDPTATTASGIQSPTIQQRRIKSTVAVQSGATVALGGLIRERSSRGKRGVPVLMDVPAIGNLFKTNSKRRDRTEILVMITPRVIRNPVQAREVAQELRKRVSLLRD